MKDISYKIISTIKDYVDNEVKEIKDYYNQEIEKFKKEHEKELNDLKEEQKKKEDLRKSYELSFQEFNEEKTFEKGSLVKYSGALLFANKDTIPFNVVKDFELLGEKFKACGFDIITDATIDSKIEVIGKNVKIIDKTLLEIKEKNFKLDFIEYKGVYKEGENYEKGDAITDNGSLWIAEEDIEKCEERPLKNKSFKLAVKNGGLVIKNKKDSNNNIEE